MEGEEKLSVVGSQLIFGYWQQLHKKHKTYYSI